MDARHHKARGVEMGDLVGSALDLFGVETGSAKAIRQAGEVQAQGAQLGATGIREQLGTSQAQFDPFQQAGLGALSQQQALLGLSGQPAQEQALAAFQESPGQAFLRQRGEQAVLRGASATGGLGGARVQEALQQQGIGFAQQDLQNQLAQLSGLSGRGLQATQNIASLGAGAAANVGTLLGQRGQAQASGILGAQQAQGQFAGDIGAVLSGGIGGFVSPKSTFGQGAAAGLLGLF